MSDDCEWEGDALLELVSDTGLKLVRLFILEIFFLIRFFWFADSVEDGDLRFDAKPGMVRLVGSGILGGMWLVGWVGSCHDGAIVRREAGASG